MNNPFLRRPPNKKRKEPRRVLGREILHGAAKEARRYELFNRSGGRCEAIKPVPTWRPSGMVAAIQAGEMRLGVRCNAPITWETMHWSHNRHAANKDDSLDAGLATCESCHLVGKHNPKSCKRRPGKPMRIKDAQEYWNGKICFCDQPKKERESFCSVCTGKLSPQIAYDLENADDPDTYRETLALAENEILMWRPA